MYTPLEVKQTLATLKLASFVKLIYVNIYDKLAKHFNLTEPSERLAERLRLKSKEVQEDVTSRKNKVFSKYSRTVKEGAAYRHDNRIRGGWDKDKSTVTAQA